MGHRAIHSVHYRAEYRLSVVASCFLLMYLSFGVAYSMPIFFPEMSHSFAIAKWHLAMLFSISGAIYFSSGLFTGPASDQFGARGVVSLGQILMALGLYLISTASAEPQLIIGYLVGVGLGVGFCFVPVTACVQKLSPEKRTTAAGMVATGIGLGTMTMPPLAHWLLTHFGWRAAIQVLACFAVAGMTAAWPLTVGLSDASAARQHRQTTVWSGQFLSLYAAQVLTSMVAFVPIAHLPFLAHERGWYGVDWLMIGLIGLGGALSRYPASALAAQFGTCRTLAFCALIMALALLALAAAGARWQLGCGALVFGCSYGGITALTGPMVSELFGSANIGRLVGYMVTSRALGLAIGPGAVGIADRYCGYEYPLLACAVLALTSSTLFEMARQEALPRAAVMFVAARVQLVRAGRR